MADITYVPSWSGFLFLAVVVDAWSRRVIGWSMATHLRTELVLEALNMEVWQRRPKKVIHRSDQGTRYTSIAIGWGGGRVGEGGASAPSSAAYCLCGPCHTP